MMPRGVAIPFLGAFLGLAILSPALPAAGPPPPSPSSPSASFSESVDVQVVNVEIYVTDRNGKPVPGLKREDFELREDGKPVVLSNFYAVDGSGAAGGDLPPGAAASTSPTPAATSPPPIPDEQRLYLALFVDERSLTVPARNRMLPLLKSFAASRLRPGDRVLVASYNGAVKVLQAPTADPAALSAALGGLTKGSAHGTERVVDRRRVLDELSLGSTSERNALSQASTTYAAVRLLAQAEFDEIRATAGALGQFVDSLAGLPGRKAVLLVSGGMSQRPGEALFEAWQNKYGRYSSQVGASRSDAFRMDTGRIFQDLVEHANANRVTFYTLAVPEDLSALPADNPGNNLLAPGLAATESLDQTQPLQTLAGATGGLAAIEQPRFLLDRLRTDLDSYYSLGYVPGHPPDGQKHRLAVTLRDRTLSARVREGYRARTGPEVTGSRTLSALLLGEGGNPFGVSLAIEGERPHGKGQFEVSLLVRLPMAKLTLVPQAGNHEGQVRIFVGARDTEGRMSDINEIVLPIRIADDKLRSVESQNVGTRVTLLLRPGRHTLAVGVRDELANTDSTVTGLYTAGRLTRDAAHAAHSGGTGGAGESPGRPPGGT
jgi:VWFA-related protein